MSNPRNVKKLFEKIQVVRPPKHRLATFGTTNINYKLVTEVPGLPDRARLRIGKVTAERPAIITPEALREQFRGFSAQAGQYADWLVSHYGEALRGLEYQFKNDAGATRIELMPPDVLVRQLTKEFDHEDSYDKTIIRGTDKMWELSVMKFIVEETLSSFSTNVRELQERGYFKRGRQDQNHHREIQFLLQKAKKDRSLIPVLGKKLKEYNLFDKYQDSFFQLLN